MAELFCYTFLFAFLIFYTFLVIVLLGQGVREGLRRRLKKARRARVSEPLPELSFSPQAPRN